MTHNNTGGKGKGAVEIDATYGVLCDVMLCDWCCVLSVVCFVYVFSCLLLFLLLTSVLCLVHCDVYFVFVFCVVVFALVFVFGCFLSGVLYVVRCASYLVPFVSCFVLCALCFVLWLHGSDTCVACMNVCMFANPTVSYDKTMKKG